VRIRRPDQKNAQDIVLEAENQMEFTLTVHPTNKSAFNIVRNIYECFRMLGDALLVKRGIESIDHIQPINALIQLNVETRRPLTTIFNLHGLRRNINYYGYHPTLAEALDAIDIAQACFKPLLNKVKEELGK
jgi:hypothetical protein